MHVASRFLLLGIAVVGLSHKAQSSEMKALQIQGLNVIEISGDLEPGDERKFADLVVDKPDALVILQSNGGDLNAGIEIGKAIRIKSLSTYAPADSPCASACALAWLGGIKRYVDNRSKIGFHAAYVLKNDQATESGVANAVVGAYLNQLGFSEKAIIYLTTAPPSDMQWLSRDAANELGIAVIVLSGSETKKMSAPNSLRAEPQLPGAITDAIDQVRALLEVRVSQWSMADLDITKYVSETYADSVYYYGKNFSNTDIYADKLRFAKVWDKRSYSIDPNSMQITCLDVNSCHASFIVSFKAFSTKNGKSSAGQARNVISLRRLANGWRIAQETGEVIARY